MPGSKSEISLVLLYNNLEDKASWCVTSYGTKLENTYPYYEVIDESMPTYTTIAKMAGPKPEVLVEEVTQGKQDEHKGSTGEAEEA